MLIFELVFAGIFNIVVNLDSGLCEYIYLLEVQAENGQIISTIDKNIDTAFFRFLMPLLMEMLSDTK